MHSVEQGVGDIVLEFCLVSTLINLLKRGRFTWSTLQKKKQLSPMLHKKILLTFDQALSFFEKLCIFLYMINEKN